MAEVRLQKYLAEAGVASRRKSEQLITEGHVSVNGVVVTELGTKVNEETDSVAVDGKQVQPEEKTVYLLMNKPVGYITTVEDTHNRKTVMDLLSGVKERVYPVGRLDADTRGLLLFTNDGEFAFRMTHPKFKMEKTYLAEVKGIISENELQQLRDGVELEDGLTAPAKVELLRRDKYRSVIELRIHEGKNRQVRRMCAAVNHEVLQLKRTEMGPLNLKGVAEGAYRHLTPQEAELLRRRLGLRNDSNVAESKGV